MHPERVPGLCYRARRRAPSCATPSRGNPDNLDALPFPKRTTFHRYFDKPIASMLSSRGCWRDCAFCSINAWYTSGGGKKFRIRSVDNIVARWRSSTSTTASASSTSRTTTSSCLNRAGGPALRGAAGRAARGRRRQDRHRGEGAARQHQPRSDPRAGRAGALPRLPRRGERVGARAGGPEPPLHRGGHPRRPAHPERLRRAHRLQPAHVRAGHDDGRHAREPAVHGPPRREPGQLLPGRGLRGHGAGTRSCAPPAAWRATTSASTTGCAIRGRKRSTRSPTSPSSTATSATTACTTSTCRSTSCYQLLRRFHPELVSETLRADVRNFIKRTNLDTFACLARIYDYAAAADPADTAGMWRFSEEMRQRVDAGERRAARRRRAPARSGCSGSTTSGTTRAPLCGSRRLAWRSRRAPPACDSRQLRTQGQPRP